MPPTPSEYPSGLPSVIRRPRIAQTTRMRSANHARSLEVVDRMSLIVLTGERRGDVIPMDPNGVVIGRGTEADCILSDEGVSRRHARVFGMGGAYYISDLASTNGTYVDGERCAMAAVRLENGARIELGGEVRLAVRAQSQEEEAVTRELYETATRDSLTRVRNRHAFDQRLARDVESALHFHRPLSLILFDVDHFKEINDHWGHLGGDAVLREIAAILRGNVRQGDLLARYGGEEFAVLALGTPLFGAELIAQRCRQRVASATFRPRSAPVRVTLSAGVATLRLDGTDDPREQLIRDADSALYQAKRGGRNQVVTSALVLEPD